MDLLQGAASAELEKAEKAEKEAELKASSMDSQEVDELGVLWGDAVCRVPRTAPFRVRPTAHRVELCGIPRPMWSL